MEQYFTEAVRLYRQATDQGFSEAQSNLGLMFEEGLGFKQDFSEAVRWFQIMAAKQPGT